MPLAWQCPFCNNHATITDHDRAHQISRLHASSFKPEKGIGADSIRCPNPKCGKYTLTVSFGDYKSTGYTTRLLNIQSWNLIPESLAKPFPDYIPEPIRQDYEEACLIRDKSPKASATLARRCLQGMIRDFFKIKRRNLAKEIEAVKPRLSPLVGQAIDAVRKVGNIGAHMEKSVDLIVEVQPNEAELLIALIEQLFKDWYIDRYEREKAMTEVIALAEMKAKQKKDKAPKPLLEDLPEPSEPTG